jgi:hypothetical protein
LLSIPLGKPPHFDGEDYLWWSHKMCSHLFLLHPCIWDIVGNGINIPYLGYENYAEVEVEELIHRIAQATTILLASLCSKEYNKVSGLQNVKEIWDMLRIEHKRNLMTKITKMEAIEGELGRFTMKRGEGPDEMYNRLKFLVNQVHNYGSKRWTDHEVVQLMLGSFTVFDANLVILVCENPRYTKMSPEEALGKFVSHQMMVKDSKYIDDMTNGSLPSTKLQVVAFKVSNDKEALPSKVEQDEATNLHDEEMALVIKRFKNALKWHKDYSNKNKSKGKCV